MLSVVPYWEENAQNGLIAALVGGVLGTGTTLKATALVIAASVGVVVISISWVGVFIMDCVIT